MLSRLVLACVLVVGGCDDHPFREPLKLGGKLVSAETLNRGRDGYQQYCRACHGERGDGRGFAAFGLRPPPRDFTQGLFKFGHVPVPELPPDEELTRIVRGGLAGTAMLPWDIPDGELQPILQYVKTFSPKWTTEVPAKAIEPSPDPFGPARASEAALLGEKLYHVKAHCSGCHPAYVTHQRLDEMSKELTGSGVSDFSTEMYLSQPKDTEYCLEWKPGWKNLDERECLKVLRELPPSFIRDPLKTVHAGSERVDLYRVIASGVGGAGMPTWKGALREEELWALAYYVESLVKLRGTDGARRLEAELNAPANLSWKP